MKSLLDRALVGFSGLRTATAGLLIWLAALAGPMAWAQEEPVITLDNLLQAGQQWAQDNLDESILEKFGEIDQDQIKLFFHDLRQRFESDYVVDLAELKRAAYSILPLLDSYEETLPYAAWLRTRLDYFDLADQYRQSLTPPKPLPGQPPPPVPNPTSNYQRKAWQKQLASKPAPTRAEQYVARLKPVFAAQQVPQQLVWLAEVESSFNANARSPADAVGLFQLRPATAKNLGLALRPEDERLHPEKSARAAARYLKYLNDRFKSWPLALAAYNAGEGRVGALLTKHQAKTFEAIAPHLPAETQMYVPKVEATLIRRENTTLSKLTPPKG